MITDYTVLSVLPLLTSITLFEVEMRRRRRVGSLVLFE